MRWGIDCSAARTVLPQGLQDGVGDVDVVVAAGAEFDVGLVLGAELLGR